MVDVAAAKGLGCPADDVRVGRHGGLSERRPRPRAVSGDAEADVVAAARGAVVERGRRQRCGLELRWKRGGDLSREQVLRFLLDDAAERVADADADSRGGTFNSRYCSESRKPRRSGASMPSSARSSMDRLQ